MNKKNYNLKQKQKNWDINLLKLDEEQLAQVTGAGNDSEWRYLPVRRF
ncbi:hypothetical protein [Anabaena sp. CCY 0017]